MSLTQSLPNHLTGARRLTLTMLTARDRADGFKGLPAGSAKPLRLLAAFQEAEPYLGLPAHAFKLVSWLVKQTMPCDWEEGSRPITWPSARRQQEFLGLSAARVKLLNRVHASVRAAPAVGAVIRSVIRSAPFDQSDRQPGAEQLEIHHRIQPFQLVALRRCESSGNAGLERGTIGKSSADRDYRMSRFRRFNSSRRT
jgi:Replication protein C N-terminal domain